MEAIEVIMNSEVSSESSVTPTIDTDPLTPQIFFGIETEPFFFLSPLFPSRISTSHFEFSNAEAAFQASKFAQNPELQSDIIKTVCIKDTIDKVQRWNSYLPVDWEERRIPVMKSLQMLKYVQNIQLQARLLQTGDAHLIYKSNTDSFFGSGHDGQGLNHLGRILMEIRSIFKAYLGTSSTGLSNYFERVTLSPSPKTRSIVWGPKIASEVWYPRKSNALKEIAIEPSIADAPAYESAFLHSIVHGDRPWTLEFLVQLREEIKEGSGGALVRICHNREDPVYGGQLQQNTVDMRLSSEHLKSSLMIDGGVYIYGFRLEVDQRILVYYTYTVSISLSPSELAERSGPEYRLIFTVWKE